MYNQGAALVQDAIVSGDIFGRDAWKEIAANVRDHGSVLHFIGLFSDGNVHSNISHLKAMVAQAKKEGLKKVRVHILLDGRDVPETSALDYVGPFEKFLDELRSPEFDVCIASGGGRMQITMDRYNANWKMVELGWKTHVLGEGRYFDNATQAIETLRGETKAIDQDLPPFVIAKDGAPVGTINDGDSVVFFNFRGDRAIEISRTSATLACSSTTATSSSRTASSFRLRPSRKPAANGSLKPASSSSLAPKRRSTAT